VENRQKLEKSERELEYQAYHDQITGKNIFVTPDGEVSSIPNSPSGFYVFGI